MVEKISLFDLIGHNSKDQDRIFCLKGAIGKPGNEGRGPKSVRGSGGTPLENIKTNAFRLA